MMVVEQIAHAMAHGSAVRHADLDIPAAVGVLLAERDDVHARNVGERGSEVVAVRMHEWRQGRGDGVEEIAGQGGGDEERGGGGRSDGRGGGGGGGGRGGDNRLPLVLLQLILHLHRGGCR